MENNSAGRELLHQVTEGPYYKKDSPERKSVAAGGTYGERLVLEGRVLDRKGNPIAGAWIDFWHADGRGEYDNAGYNLRGHQYTDETGHYRLETVTPSEYSARTPHIHVKLQASPQSPVVTTQLFFPDVERNRTDPVYDPALVMDVSDGTEGKQARFDFVLDVE